MLMGAFQGNVDDITISKRNMLKYWERKDVFWTADRFLKNYCDPKFMPFQGQGIECVASNDGVMLCADAVLPAAISHRLGAGLRVHVSLSSCA